MLDALPSVVCAADLTVTGTSAPGARVVVRTGTLAFSGYADTAGRFAVVLPLPGNGWQLLRVAAEDASGVRGPEATATVRVDCSSPSVVAAAFDRDAATITVELSEPIDPATAALGAGASVTLDDAEVPGAAPDPAGSLSVTGDGSVLEIAVDPAADAWWREQPVRLTVRPPLADIQGNPMAAAFETVFFPTGSGGPAGGFLFGEAWSDVTGRPLDGVTARLFVSGDALPGAVAPGGAATPLAEVVTDARGRFQIAGDVAPGRYVLVLEGADTTRVVRRLTLGPGAGAVPFDSRLTALAPTAGELDPVAGGTLTAPDAPLVSLTADPAAVPGLDPLAVRFTVLGDQALPDLLPLGWTPASAAELRLEDASGALPEGDATPFAAGGVRLTLPLPPWVLASDVLQAARYDLATGAWRTLAAPERLDGPDGEPLARVTLDGPGTVAVLLPDSGDATRPPLPAGPGETLAGAALPETAPSLLGELVLDPPVIPPTEHADARVVARSADGVTPWPSGLAVRAVLAETLHLSDGSQLLEAPFTADLVLYRPHLSPAELGGAVEAAAGAADFVVSPSPRASEVLLDVGYEDVTLYPFPEQIERGHVVGPSGGRVTSDGGVELELPEGALPAATVVRASLLDATALAGLPAVDGFDTLAAISVELGGRTLARAATLRLPAPDGAPGDDPSDPRLVLAERIDSAADGHGPLVRPVARASRPDGGRIVAAPEAAGSGLPLTGLRGEGLYLVLRAQSPLAWATGTVRATNGVGLAGSRVTAAGLGTGDLSREGGVYATAVPCRRRDPERAPPEPRRDRHRRRAGRVAGRRQHRRHHRHAGAADRARGQSDRGRRRRPGRHRGLGDASPRRSTRPPSPARPSSSPSPVQTASPPAPSSARPSRSPTPARLVVLQPTLPLSPGRSYVATFAGGVRDVGGTPYAGGPVSWSFTTSTAVVLGGEVHPELFHIERPVDGVAVVTGAPGALPVAPAGFTPWSVSPVIDEDVADPVVDTFSADTVGGVSATVGHPPGHPVTEASRVWLRVFDSDGNLAEQFRLGPFATADGRGFIAPPGEDSTFTTADGVAVDVPAGAFDEPTLVTVTPLDPAGIGADLPDGMALGAYVRLDFAGEAHDTLRVHVPAPAGLAPGTQAFMVTPVDLPWGRRLRLIDVGGVLDKDGTSYLSNDPTLQPELPPDAGGGGGGEARLATLDSSPSPPVPRRSPLGTAASWRSSLTRCATRRMCSSSMSSSSSTSWSPARSFRSTSRHNRLSSTGLRARSSSCRRSPTGAATGRCRSRRASRSRSSGATPPPAGTSASKSTIRCPPTTAAFPTSASSLTPPPARRGWSRRARSSSCRSPRRPPAPPSGCAWR